MSLHKVDTIVFDLGGVLIDWNPRYLYRKIFESESEVEWFLDNICTGEWNDQQDGGRSFAEATEELLLKHPEWEVPIRAWYDRWQETISGSIAGTVEILKEVKASERHKLLALTNWSAETFPWALENFEFLHWFEGIVVSGIEKTRKPHREIFDILVDRYSLHPSRSLFIDDNQKNIAAAAQLGFQTIRFENPEQLRQTMKSLALLD